MQKKLKCKKETLPFASILENNNINEFEKDGFRERNFIVGIKRHKSSRLW